MHLDDQQTFHRYLGESYELAIGVVTPADILPEHITEARFTAGPISKTLTGDPSDVSIELVEPGLIIVGIDIEPEDQVGMVTDTYIFECSLELQHDPVVVSRGLFILDRSLTLEASE